MSLTIRQVVVDMIRVFDRARRRRYWAARRDGLSVLKALQFAQARP
jgi:hypothetical protein